MCAVVGFPCPLGVSMTALVSVPNCLLCVVMVPADPSISIQRCVLASFSLRPAPALGPSSLKNIIVGTVHLEAANHHLKAQFTEQKPLLKMKLNRTPFENPLPPPGGSPALISKKMMWPNIWPPRLDPILFWRYDFLEHVIHLQHTDCRSDLLPGRNTWHCCVHNTVPPPRSDASL